MTRRCVIGNFRYPHSPASLPHPDHDWSGFTALSSERDRSIEDYVSALMPTGSILAWAGAPSATVPKGWRLCDGTTYSRDSYRNLYLVIGTTWGVGDGTSTFNVPDLRGRTLFGQNTADGDFATLGQTGGNKAVVTGAVPAHTHGMNFGSQGESGHSHSHDHGLTNHNHGGGTGVHSHTFTGGVFGTSNTAHTHYIGGSPGEVGTAPQGTGRAGSTADLSTVGVANTNQGVGDATGSSGHAHTISGTTDNGSGGASANGNLPPYAVVRYIIKI